MRKALGTIYTEQDQETIEKLLDQNMPTRDIAKQLNRSVSALRVQIFDGGGVHKYTKEAMRKVDNGFHRLLLPNVRDYDSRKGRRRDTDEGKKFRSFTDNERNICERGLNEGLMYKEIAKLLNRSFDSVRGHINRHGCADAYTKDSPLERPEKKNPKVRNHKQLSAYRFLCNKHNPPEPSFQKNKEEAIKEDKISINEHLKIAEELEMRVKALEMQIQIILQIIKKE
jgi:IS30 family transposase